MDWSSFLPYPVDELPFVFLVLLLAFTVHEFAHAYLADKFGDPTPRAMGRVTLNPRVHLDWLGMIFFLIVGIGWAKPVLINRGRFKHPRAMGIAVSFAGPFSNLVLGFISLVFVYAFHAYGWLDGMSPGVSSAVLTFFALDGYSEHISIHFKFDSVPAAGRLPHSGRCAAASLGDQAAAIPAVVVLCRAADVLYSADPCGNARPDFRLAERHFGLVRGYT